MSKISVIQTPDYGLQRLVQAVRRHFARFHLEEKLHAGTRVLIKPNLVMKRAPEEFTTTHPALVEAAIICLKELGVQQITLADSPGGPYTEAALKGIYEVCGMREVCERQNITLNYDCRSKERNNPANQLVKSFLLIQPVHDADFILDICKLKSHAMTGLSGAVKNLFGTIPGLIKPEFHWRFPDKELFCKMLVDLSQTVCADFALVDAVEAMEGDGPSGGDKRIVNLTMASDNLYELDYYLCKLIGTDPHGVYTVKASLERGLCEGTPEVLGDPVQKPQPFRMPHDRGLDFTHKVPKLLQKPAKFLVRQVLTSKPKIRTRDCIGCGKCAESCPPHTIAIVGRKAVIDEKQCIQCFCCHEMCPVKAIDIRRFFLFRKGGN